MRLCRPRMDSAITAMTAPSKATDMAWRARVRMLIWTDMAPTCAKVAAMAVAARSGMSMVR